MTGQEVLNLGLQVFPIIGGLIWAVIKIGKMIDDKMKTQEQSWVRLLMDLKTEFKKAVDDLWASQTRQDARVENLTKNHYRLEGRLGITDKKD